MEPMRALSIHQPFAWAIAAGFKKVENRSWTTNYRGPVAIQASVNRERIKELQANLGEEFDASLFAFGAVVGVADLVDVQPLNPDLESDPWAEGPYCWIFENPRLLARPVKAKGKTSLFKLSLAESTLVLNEQSAPSLREADYGDLLIASQCDPYERHVVRANLYLDNQQHGDALRCISKAIDLDPSFEEAWRVRAIALLEEGRDTEALDDANEAVRLAPDYGLPYLARAAIWKAIGNTEQQMADRRQALVLQPELAELDLDN